jgi:hypothetical protein
LELSGTISRSFDLISSEYGWDDEVILDKTLRRIRQITVDISLRLESRRKERRLELSWQTRSLAMVMAAAGGNASEDLMKFASNLTIDNEEYELFGGEQPKAVTKSKLPVHATTQETATQANFEAAADRNNFDMLALFGMNMEKGKPGE